MSETTMDAQTIAHLDFEPVLPKGVRNRTVISPGSKSAGISTSQPI